MKRLAVVSVFALAACAGGQPEITAQPAPAPGGNWVVTDAVATAAAPVETSPYLGQVVTLDAGRAIDPSGRLCKAPVYRTGQGDPTTELGLPPEGKASPSEIVTVLCDGTVFGTFVAHGDGWRTRANAWVLTLSREKPAAVAAPVPVAPVPAPTASTTVTPPAPAPQKDPRTLVYLASYKTAAAATQGFATLAKASSILAKQQPVTQAVDLGKKGKWVRLYGMAADEAERTTICKQVGKRVDECGARNRE